MFTFFVYRSKELVLSVTSNESGQVIDAAKSRVNLPGGWYAICKA